MKQYKTMMNKAIYQVRPPEQETILSAGTMTTVIRFNIEESESESSETVWTCDELEYSHREPLTYDKDYGHIVTAIIRTRYSADEMEALLNNYVSSKTTEHKREWTEMQAWRAAAKERAQEVINLVNTDEE